MDNEAMQDSGVEWIGAIPLGWRFTRIKRITERIQTGTTPPTSRMDFFESGNIAWYTPASYSNSIYLSKPAKLINETAYYENKLRIFKKNSIFWVGIGATIGKVAISPEPSSCNQQIIGIECSEDVIPKFLYFMFKFYESIIPKIAQYTTLPIVDQVKLGYLMMPYPVIAEQQAIAKYLDQRCGKLDAIIDIKQQQIKALDALRQSIIYHAVTKGLDDPVSLVDSGVEWLGKIPQGWRVSKLKYITNQIVDGTHFTPNYVESGIPFLRVTDIQTQSINFDRIKFITEEEHTELTKRAKPQKGDVLLSKNGTIGITKVVEWDWEFSIFVSLCLIKFLPNINPYYFSYFFESDVVNQQLFESSKKTSVTNLHLVKIRELLLCVPSFPEQQSIVDYLDLETQRLNNLKANLNQQINTLQAYKKSLIYECVTGKKRIKSDDLKAG
jgi:type I restriction enzyme, S subunit